MVVQGLQPQFRYQRIVSGQGDPAQVEAELMALEQNVSMATGQAGNLVSHGANTMLEGHIDMRSRVDAANVVATDPVTGTPAPAVPTTGPSGPLGADGPANTFTNQTYTSGETSGSTYTTRLFGNNELHFQNRSSPYGDFYYDAQPTGQFLAEGVPQNLASGRQTSALPPGGTAGLWRWSRWLRVPNTIKTHRAGGNACRRRTYGVPQRCSGGQHGPLRRWWIQGRASRARWPRSVHRGCDAPIPTLWLAASLTGRYRLHGDERMQGPRAPSASRRKVLDDADAPDVNLDWDGLVLARSTSIDFYTARHSPTRHRHWPKVLDGRVRGRHAEATGQTGEAYGHAAGSGPKSRKFDQSSPRPRPSWATWRSRSRAITEGESNDETEADDATAQQGGQRRLGRKCCRHGGGPGQQLAVRGLVTVGTGGRAIASGINAVGSLFGADEPVIDTSSIEQSRS